MAPLSILCELEVIAVPYGLEWLNRKGMFGPCHNAFVGVLDTVCRIWLSFNLY